MVLECSLFQNIVEDMLLFRNASDQEILSFYEEQGKVLADKKLHIMYLASEDVAANINVIRKERSDEHGNEMWFPLVLGYFNESPFAKAHGFFGEDAMIGHFLHRQELELKICREIFPGRYTVLKSKNWKRSHRYSKADAWSGGMIMGKVHSSPIGCVEQPERRVYK